MTKLPPDTPLDGLPLSVRSYNVMSNAGVRTLQDLADLIADPSNALRLPNFGRRSLSECSEVVARMKKVHRAPAHPLEGQMRQALEAHRAEWSRLLEIHRDIESVLTQVKILAAVLENVVGRTGPQPSIRSLEAKIERLSVNMIMLANRIRGSGITGETFPPANTAVGTEHECHNAGIWGEGDKP